MYMCMYVCMYIYIYILETSPDLSSASDKNVYIYIYVYSFTSVSYVWLSFVGKLELFGLLEFRLLSGVES